MTRICVEVSRDDQGRLHGTVDHDGDHDRPVGFTGVIELVATVEALLDRDQSGVDGPRGGGRV